ncbi:MAG: hypothetical protein DMG59_09935 [Acidobacteria bacterium]|nr:MAG: hypothetical protein DMG59_09935 [Acidobacteriota bacterium]
MGRALRGEPPHRNLVLGAGWLPEDHGHEHFLLLFNYCRAFAWFTRTIKVEQDRFSSIKGPGIQCIPAFLVAEDAFAC